MKQPVHLTLDGRLVRTERIAKTAGVRDFSTPGRGTYLLLVDDGAKVRAVRFVMAE